MASNTGEIRLPRVAKHQRLVLVNRHDPGMDGIDRIVCDENNHVPEARVPNEGLGYMYITDGGMIIWMCAFCGHQKDIGWTGIVDRD